MPFVSALKPEEANITGFDAQAEVVPQFSTPTADLRDVAQSFLRGETTFGSIANDLASRWDVYFASRSGYNPEAPGYDPFEDQSNLSLIEEDPDLARAFTHARTPMESFFIRKRVAQERRDDETMASAGPAGVATMFALGAVDPVNMLPFGAAGRAYSTGRVVRGVLEGATAGLLSSAAGETVLQGTQLERPTEESLINISAATLLSGALGGGIGLLKGRNVKEIEDAFKANLLDARARFTGTEGAGGGGAQMTERTTLRQETMKGAAGFENLGANKSPVGNPLQRLLTSPSVEVRRMVQKLAENPIMMAGASEDVTAPIAAETRIKMWDANLSQALSTLDEAFAEHRFGQQTFGARFRAGIEDIAGKRDPNKLTYDQFRTRVAMALRRGDIDEMFPEVSKAAKKIREEVLEPLKQEAIALKQLPEDVAPKTADSYFTRVYNTEKIAARRPEFEAKAIRYLKGLEGVDGMDAGDIELIARQVTDTILGNNGTGAATFKIQPNQRGPLKERTFLIPDKDIEDFLDNDVERVLRIYKRKMSADVEIARAFGRPDMQDQLGGGEVTGEIADSYAKARKAIEDDQKLNQDQKEKRLTALQKQLERDIKDLAAIRDRLRGTYNVPKEPQGMLVRAGRVARGINYLRLMGGVAPGSLPDVGSIALYHGMGRLMRTGIVPLVTNLKKYKLAARETRLAGSALDWVLDTRAMAWADIGEDYGRYSGFERGLKYASDKFGIMNLASVWNHHIKGMAGAMSQTRTLEAVEALANGKASKKEIERLNFLGVNRNLADRINTQFQKHGINDDGGLRWANTEAWDDREAVEALRAAIVKETDATIITPGQEKPLWMSTEWGGMIGQFRSFTISAMARLTVAGLQRRDAAVLQGLVMTTALGMMSYFLKVRSEDIDWENPATWIKEGVDRGGALGWIFEANNMLEKLTGNMVGLSPLLGQGQTSRFAGRGVIAAGLGPSFGLGEDVFTTFQNIARGEATGSDIHRLRKLLPFQNIFWLRYMADQVENAITESAGFPSRAESRSQ